MDGTLSTEKFFLFVSIFILYLCSKGPWINHESIKIYLQ